MQESETISNRTSQGVRTNEQTIANAVALAQSLGIREAARQMHLAPMTVSRWVNEKRMAPQSAEEGTKRAELVTQQRSGLTEAFLDIATAAQKRAMEVIPDTKDLKALVLAAAISTDKALLLSGGATSRSEHVVRFVGADSLRSLAAGDVSEGEFTELHNPEGTDPA